MIQAVTNMTVPKLTLQIGGSFGAGNYGMCGRGFDPRFIFSWPNCRTAVMGGPQAAATMRIVAEEAARKKGNESDPRALDAIGERIVEQYDRESRALYGTARLWDDGLIDPRDSRDTLRFCLDVTREASRLRARPTSFGVARL
jgi:geranyl-CoA carboxylase beta subunit